MGNKKTHINLSFLNQDEAFFPVLFSNFSKLVTLPSTLLHDGADELTNESQELVCVSGVELLEEGEQAEHERRPVDRVSGFPAGHS